MGFRFLLSEICCILVEISACRKACAEAEHRKHKEYVYTSRTFREQNSNPRLQYTSGRREYIRQNSAFTEI